MQTVEAEAGTWLPLAEAAQALGIATDTLRRRVKRGEVEARLVPSRRGPAYEVRLDDAPTVEPEPMQPSTAALVALVGCQEQTIIELSGRVGWLQAELQQAREQLALVGPGATGEKSPIESAPLRRRWWHLW